MPNSRRKAAVKWLWLEKPYQLAADPWWDPIRDDPRFGDLLRRLRLTPVPAGQRSPGT
jgi:hypothetical protein